MRDEQIMLLKDKFGIVTGAAGGMGRAAVALFAREGAGILCADIDTAAERRTLRPLFLPKESKLCMLR